MLDKGILAADESVVSHGGKLNSDTKWIVFAASHLEGDAAEWYYDYRGRYSSLPQQPS